MTFIVDASLVIGLLANRQSDEVLQKRLSASRSLHAPHLLDAEVASGICGLTLGKRVDADRAAMMLDDFVALRITRHPMAPLLHRVLELRANLSAYDATYVALAESMDLPFLTRDARLGRSIGHRADVQVYP